MAGPKDTKQTHTIVVEMEEGTSVRSTLQNLEARGVRVAGSTVRMNNFSTVAGVGDVKQTTSVYVPSDVDLAETRRRQKQQVQVTARRAQLASARGERLSPGIGAAVSSLVARIDAGEDVSSELQNFKADIESELHGTRLDKADAGVRRRERATQKRLRQLRGDALRLHAAGASLSPAFHSSYGAASDAVAAGAPNADELLQTLAEDVANMRSEHATSEGRRTFGGRLHKMEHVLTKARAAGLALPGMQVLETGIAQARALHAGGGSGVAEAKNLIASGDMTDALQETTKALRELTNPQRGLPSLGQRIAMATAVQRGFGGGTASVFGALQTPASMGGPAAGLLTGAAGAGANVMQSIGFGRMVAGAPGGVGLLAGGAILGAAVAGLGALSSGGASIRERVTPKVASFQRTYGRNTMVGPTAAEHVIAAGETAVYGDKDGYIPVPSTGGMVNVRARVTAATQQEERLRKMQHRWWMSAARRGRSGNELLGEVVGGAGGRRLTDDQLETSRQYALDSGFSGAGYGALAAFGEGGGFGYAARGLTISAQSMGLDADGGSAMMASLGELLQARQAAGLSADLVATTNLQRRLAGGGVSPSRALGVHQGLGSAQAGARQQLLGGFQGLGQAAALLQALENSGGDIMQAATALEDTSPESTMDFMLTRFGPELGQAGLRAVGGLRGREAARVAGGDMSGLNAEVQAVPDAAVAMSVPELLREGNAILHADNSQQLEMMRKIDSAIDDLKASVNDGFRSLAGTR